MNVIEAINNLEFAAKSGQFTNVQIRTMENELVSTPVLYEGMFSLISHVDSKASILTLYVEDKNEPDGFDVEEVSFANARTMLLDFPDEDNYFEKEHSPSRTNPIIVTVIASLFFAFLTFKLYELCHHSYLVPFFGGIMNVWLVDKVYTACRKVMK